MWYTKQSGHYLPRCQKKRKEKCPVGKVLLSQNLFYRGREQTSTRKHRTWFPPSFRARALTVWLMCLQSLGGDLIPHQGYVRLGEIRWDEIRFPHKAFVTLRTKCKVFHHYLPSTGQMPGREWTLNNSILKELLITLYGGGRMGSPQTWSHTNFCSYQVN